MPEYYVLKFKCNNCYDVFDLKFPFGVEAAKQNAGTCKNCGVCYNEVAPRPSYQTYNIDIVPIGKTEERRGGKC